MNRLAPFLFTLASVSLSAEPIVVDSSWHHLRNTAPREWNHFPLEPDTPSLSVTFDLSAPAGYRQLTLRQADVKQTWDVSLNGRTIGKLDRDDGDLEHAIPIPDGLLRNTGNNLHIGTKASAPDDIRVGAITLHPAPDTTLTGQMQVVVKDSNSGSAIPCRLTIVDADTLHRPLLGAASDDRLAVRPGVIYTLDGSATFSIRPGRYRIWAGRGFEYSLAETEVEVKAAANQQIELSLTREVDTAGLVACDPHLHTNEFARHGDATLVERLITIAGEGIELPISTEHDQHIDYSSEAERIGARRFFTPVVGCEVTTKLGHFNSFPIDPGAPVAKHRLREWPKIFDSIFATPGVRVVILNHPRDVHGGFRPFDPDRFNPATGEFTDGRILRANALEVINSGAQQSDPMRPVSDWMALLKSGHRIAAIGSSDSHTVNFAIVGQARTYIPCDDASPGKIDVPSAVQAIVDGETLVSFGLLTKLKPTPAGDTLEAEVHAPSWITASSITLFADGAPISTLQIPAASARNAGLKFKHTWPLDDLPGAAGSRTLFVAVATGPGIDAPFWRMMPPYQAESPKYSPYVMGISSPVRLKRE